MALKSPMTRRQVTAEGRRVVSRLLSDKTYRAALKRRIIQGRAPHLELWLWYYAYGAPKGMVDVTMKLPSRRGVL